MTNTKLKTAQWCLPVILALRRPRQEDGSEFKTSLGYRVSFKVQGQPVLHKETLSQTTSIKKERKLKNLFSGLFIHPKDLACYRRQS